MSHKTPERAITHYNSKRHIKAVQKLLKLKIETYKFLYIRPPRSEQGTGWQTDSSKRLNALDNKEADMRQLWENYSSEEYHEDKPWLTEDVNKFVSQSVQDFQTLLKWLEDLQTEKKWDNGKINDITYGLGKIPF